MWIVLDLIVVAIIAAIALISAHKGFVRTIVEIVGFALVILLADAVSPMISDVTYDKYIQSAIIDSIGDVQIDEEFSEDSINEILDENFPPFVTKLLGDEFEVENFTESINENINEGVDNAITKASKNIIKPIVVKILNLIYTLIIVSVLFVVVKFVAKLAGKLCSFSLIGKANKILGGVLGIIKGVAYVAMICSIVTLIVSLIPNGIGFLNEATIESTLLFKLLSVSI